MAFLDSKVGKPVIKKENAALGDVSALINLTGGTQGSVAISFSKDCVLGIADNMLGETFKSIDQDVLDLVGEMCNMVSGEARRELAELGFQFSAGIPRTLMGEEHLLEHHINGPTINIPFQTKFGPFFIEACFESEQFFQSSKESQEETTISHENNVLTRIEVSSSSDPNAPQFPIYLLKPNSQYITKDLFLINEYTRPKKGYDLCNYLKFEVFVCPKTYFASNRLEYFHQSFTPLDNRLEEPELKGYLFKKLDKMSLIGELPKSFYSTERSIEQAITSFDLAIFTSNALYGYDPIKFEDELDKIVEYSFKAALLAKIQLNIQRELKYLKAAFSFLKKLLDLKPNISKLSRVLYLLTAISVYIGDTQGSKVFFDQLFKIYQENFESLKTSPMGIEVKEYMELTKKVWSLQEQINIKKLRNLKNYLFLDGVSK
ncbi:MAG: chemotaxis protein CheX [bacterium]|jgi:chemotaxis protein CheX